MRKYNVSANLVRTISQFYDNATSCSPDEWQHGIMVKDNSWSKARVSFVTHPLQHSIKEWMAMDIAGPIRQLKNRTGWKEFVAKSSVDPNDLCGIDHIDITVQC